MKATFGTFSDLCMRFFVVFLTGGSKGVSPLSRPGPALLPQLVFLSLLFTYKGVFRDIFLTAAGCFFRFYVKKWKKQLLFILLQDKMERAFIFF